jgi:endonuclease/exonuclease/phosphatase (EEP) superfamily protein YafD
MNASPDHQKPGNELRRPILVGGAWILILAFVLWSVGQVLRDVTWYTALCFYIPSPLLAFALLWQTCWLMRCNRKRLAGVLGVLALFPLSFTVAIENQWAAPAAPTVAADLPRLRLVHWNVWYARRGWEPILRQLAELHADIYVLSEAPRTLDVSEAVAALGPDFTVQRFEDMAILARGELHVHERRPIGRHGWGRLVDWDSPAGRFRLLTADFPSHPRTHRAPLLAELERQIVQQQPDMIVGDFNAPRRSPGLMKLPDGYRHAYLTAGSGWSYTWPIFCPLWAIDQCIAGPRATPLHYELQSTSLSDHRLQVCDFVVSRSKDN